MKSIGGFLKYKKIRKSSVLDEESVFYVLKNIIKVKYGEVGALSIKPDFYKNGTIFVKTANSNWSGELWLNKGMLIDELNKKIGENEIKEIKIKQN